MQVLYSLTLIQSYVVENHPSFIPPFKSNVTHVIFF